MSAPLLLLLAWKPFIDPPPHVWDYWYLLPLPLCLGVSIVYKSIKCPSMKQVPREAAVAFLSIISGLLVAAAVLFGLVRFAVG